MNSPCRTHGPCLPRHHSDVTMIGMASQIAGVSVVCSGTDKRKDQSPASLAIVRGIHRWPVDSPHKGPVTWKCFHFMTSSWWMVSTARTFQGWEIMENAYTFTFLNSSPPRAPYMHPWNESALVQVMACRLVGTKPLPESTLIYCERIVEWWLEHTHGWLVKCQWAGSILGWVGVPRWIPSAWFHFHSCQTWYSGLLRTVLTGHQWYHPKHSNQARME